MERERREGWGGGGREGELNVYDLTQGNV